MREGIVTALARPNGAESRKEPPEARGRTPGDRVPRSDLVHQRRGKSARVPENWVEIEGDSRVMKRDYDATELSVGVGAALTLEFEESGWAWATTVTGEGIIWTG